MVRGRRLDGNPLRRRSDRAETALLGLLLAVFLAGAAFAAHAAGSWAYATSTREAHAQQAREHQVKATLLQDALAWTVYATPDVQARWRGPDGQVRTGAVSVPGGAKAGTTVTVWTDHAGQLTEPPLQHPQVVSRAQLAEGSAVGGLAVTLIVTGWLAHRSLDRRRLAAWDADWLATGPRWTFRR